MYMVGITVGVQESRRPTVILEKLQSVTFKKPQWITAILIRLPWYQTHVLKILCKIVLTMRKKMAESIGQKHIRCEIPPHVIG